METESSAVIFTRRLQKIVQSRTATCEQGCDGAAFYLYLRLLESLEGLLEANKQGGKERESGDLHQSSARRR